MNQSFLLTLRVTAQRTRNEQSRQRLYEAADLLDLALRGLHKCPTELAMQAVNCAWARADLLRRAAELENDKPPGGAGLVEGARLAA